MPWNGGVNNSAFFIFFFSSATQPYVYISTSIFTSFVFFFFNKNNHTYYWYFCYNHIHMFPSDERLNGFHLRRRFGFNRDTVPSERTRGHYNTATPTNWLWLSYRFVKFRAVYNERYYLLSAYESFTESCRRLNARFHLTNAYMMGTRVMCVFKKSSWTRSIRISRKFFGKT